MKNERTYTLSQIRRMKGKSDRQRISNTTEAEIAQTVRDDADWSTLESIDWAKAILTTPAKKKAISIRLDEEVLDFFKRDGAGYQRRMNAVLRHFVAEHQKKKRA